MRRRGLLLLLTLLLTPHPVVSAPPKFLGVFSPGSTLPVNCTSATLLIDGKALNVSCPVTLGNLKPGRYVLVVNGTQYEFAVEVLNLSVSWDGDLHVRVETSKGEVKANVTVLEGGALLYKGVTGRIPLNLTPGNHTLTVSTEYLGLRSSKQVSVEAGPNITLPKERFNPWESFDVEFSQKPRKVTLFTPLGSIELKPERKVKVRLKTIPLGKYLIKAYLENTSAALPFWYTTLNVSVERKGPSLLIRVRDYVTGEPVSGKGVLKVNGEVLNFNFTGEALINLNLTPGSYDAVVEVVDRDGVQGSGSFTINASGDLNLTLESKYYLPGDEVRGKLTCHGEPNVTFRTPSGRELKGWLKREGSIWRFGLPLKEAVELGNYTVIGACYGVKEEKNFTVTFLNVSYRVNGPLLTVEVKDYLTGKGVNGSAELKVGEKAWAFNLTSGVGSVELPPGKYRGSLRVIDERGLEVGVQVSFEVSRPEVELWTDKEVYLAQEEVVIHASPPVDKGVLMPEKKEVNFHRRDGESIAKLRLKPGKYRLIAGGASVSFIVDELHVVAALVGDKVMVKAWWAVRGPTEAEVLVKGKAYRLSKGKVMVPLTDEVVVRADGVEKRVKVFSQFLDVRTGDSYLLIFPGQKVNLCEFGLRLKRCVLEASRVMEVRLPNLKLPAKVKAKVGVGVASLDYEGAARVVIPVKGVPKDVQVKGGVLVHWKSLGDKVVAYVVGGGEVTVIYKKVPERPPPKEIGAVSLSGSSWKLLVREASNPPKERGWISLGDGRYVKEVLEAPEGERSSFPAEVVYSGNSVKVIPKKAGGEWIRIVYAVPEDKAVVRVKAPPGTITFFEGPFLIIYTDPAPVEISLADPKWWDPDGVGVGYDWHYRVEVTVNSPEKGKTAKVDVKFNSLLEILGVTGDFDENSVRVVDVYGNLLTYQEFNDVIYEGATDALNDGKGEVKFILESDVATYFIYFDIVENGAKPAWTNVINGNFEHSSPGDVNPPGWTSGSINTGGGENREIHPLSGEGTTVSVSDPNDGTANVDNTPRTGNYYFLLGYRDNSEDGSSGVHEEVYVERVVYVPASGGYFDFYFCLQGWDTKAQNDAYDYVRVYVNGTNVRPEYVDNDDGHILVDPETNYYGFGRDQNYLGYGNYSDEGWRLVRINLSDYAGSNAQVRITIRHYSDSWYKTWIKLDDAEWFITSASVGTAQGFGINIVEPADTAAGYPESIYSEGDTVTFQVQSDVGQYLESGAGNTMYGVVQRWNGADWVNQTTLTFTYSTSYTDYAVYTADWTAEQYGIYRLMVWAGQPPDFDNGYVVSDVQTFRVVTSGVDVDVTGIEVPSPCGSFLCGGAISEVRVNLTNWGDTDSDVVRVLVRVYNQTSFREGYQDTTVPAGDSVEVTVSFDEPIYVVGTFNISARLLDPDTSNPYNDLNDENNERHRLIVTGWWDSSWQYRRLVNVFSERDLSDYQIRVVLDSSWFDYSKVSANGDDLRFVWYDWSSSSLVELNYWIERWDTSGESVIWVKVPRLYARWEVPVFMYYGNPEASAVSDMDATMDFIEFRKVTTTNTISTGEDGNDPSTWTWDALTFYKSYENPVIVAQFLSYNGGHSAVIRIRDVTSTSMQVRVIEPSLRDNVHLSETVGVIVLNEGTYQFLDGTRIEAHKFETTATVGARVSNVWVNLQVSLDYPVDPIVISQPMTSNDISQQARFVKTRERYLRDYDGIFQLALEEEYDNSAQRSTPETVAWIAFQRDALDQARVGRLPRFTNDPSPVPYEIGVAYDAVRGIGNGWYTASFTQTFNNAPILILGYGSYDGGHNSELRYRNLGTTGFQVAVEEDYTHSVYSSSDYEGGTRHVTEDVFWVAVESEGAYPIAKYVDPPPVSRVCAEEVAPLQISGKIYEDLDGDGVVEAGEPGTGGVGIRVYKDDGDGLLDDGDTFTSLTVTLADGSYSACIPGPGTYFVVVNSRDVRSSRPLNPSYTWDQVWADQTYGCDYAGSLSCSKKMGGVNPQVSDFWNTSLAVSDNRYEHVSKVEATSSVSGIDFAFSFEVIVNARDSDDSPDARYAQGTLRQFLVNANALSGPDRSQFWIPTSDPGFTGSYWTITLNSSLGPLPSIVDDGTVLDGGTQTENVADTNAATLGSSGHLGTGEDGIVGSGDECYLTGVSGPEVEIYGNGVDNGITVEASDVWIMNLSIYGFSGDHGDGIFVPSGFSRTPPASGYTNVSIIGCLIGARADGSDPQGSSLLRNEDYGVEVKDVGGGALLNVSVVQSLVMYNGMTGIHFSTPYAKGTVNQSEVAYNGQLVGVEDGIGVETEAEGVTVYCSYLHHNAAYGFDSWDSKGGFVIKYCNVTDNGVVADQGEDGGIRVFGNHSLVLGNVISGNANGIVVARMDDKLTLNNTLLKNAIFNNTELGIDLDLSGTAPTANPNGDGVSPNDGSLSDGPNGGVDYPVITQAAFNGTHVYVKGYVNVEGSGAGSSNFAGGKVHVYLVNGTSGGDNLVGNQQGSSYYGEGVYYLGELTVDSEGEFGGWLEACCGLTVGSWITGTTTLDGYGTSEFGPDAQVITYVSGVKVMKEVYEDDPCVNNVTITVMNLVDSPAYIKVYDVIPYGTELINSNPPASGSSGQVVWWLISLGPAGDPTDTVVIRYQLSSTACGTSNYNLTEAFTVGVDPPGYCPLWWQEGGK